MMEYTDWQQRLINEYNETYDRLIKLTRFIESPDFDQVGDGERQDLRRQRNLMLEYLSVLDSRVSRFIELRA